MLRYILDRCLTATILYCLFAATLVHYADFLPRYLYLSSLALSTILIVKNNAGYISKELRISRLGSRAPRIRTWTPSNIGFIIKAIKSFKADANDVLWWDNFKEAGKQTGQDSNYTIETIVLGNRLLLTSEPDNIKAILATQFNDFEKGATFTEDWRPMLGHGIFNADGEVWQRSRALMRPQFVKDRVSDLIVFENHIQELLPFLRGSHPGQTVRVDDLLQRYTLDVATDFLFGFNVGSLKNSDSAFARTFNDVQHTQATIARAGPLKAFVPKRRYHEAIKELHAFTDQFIDKALALSPDELAKRTQSDAGYTLLHAMVAETRDREELRSTLIASILAGRDTTSSSLMWLLYELSRHPEIVAKLRKEIDAVIGLNTDNIPTYSSLKSLRYLSHVINEQQRLYSVVPFNVRSAAVDTTLPTGGLPDGKQPITVLKDTQVGYSTLVMHNRADILPKDSPAPEVFAPERWETYRGTSGYYPFSGGPRICLGQSFAKAQLGYTLVRLLQHFSRIEDRNGGFPGYKTDIVLMPARGINVAFYE